MVSGVSPQRTVFARLRIPKASELFAQQVRTAIVLGDLPPGTSLAPEKELLSQLGVSRATIREGLRLLEAEGLITTRRGRGGGATVCRPSVGTHLRSLALLLQFDGTTLGDLLEARRVIKPPCARLAAERISPAQLAGMRAALDELRALTDTPEAYHGAQVRFHLLIAQATGNAVLRIYTNALAELIYEQLREVPFTREDLEAGAAACARILEALEQGDGERAERRLARHLDAVEAGVARLGRPLHEHPADLAGVAGSRQNGPSMGRMGRAGRLPVQALQSAPSGSSTTHPSGGTPST